ncbi:MAG: Y-family DNA polymerase [Steroidobacteraceae bacterium]
MPLARTRPRELWLAAHLPSSMLDALRGDLDGPERRPLAVVDIDRNGKVVCACDEAASRAGVRAGMSVNSALALLPALQALARQERREKHLLDAIARRALHFTPRVSLEPPDAVLLEVRGSLRLFGGARALCERLRREISAATGATVRLAITPTPLASLWFARMNAGERVVLVRSPDELSSRLAPLPLACTRWPERTLQTLATMGVHNIGECLRLPRDGFARRFGAELLAMLDRATGRLAEPRSAFAAHEKFALRRDLEPEVGDTARLLQVIEPMLGELCRFLRERCRGIQALEFQLRHRESPATRVRLRFVQPLGAQPQRMAELLRERLGRLELPEPVRTLRLLSGPLIDLHAEAPELFAYDRRESGENVPALVERLRARLGNAAVHGLACVAEHRPEAAWRALEPLGPEGRDAASGAAPAGKGREVAGESNRRPLWLLDVPEPCDLRRLELEEGPECIESGWWDGYDVARDYYVARNPHGARLWVFRNRRDTDASGWFLHGWFA